MRNVHLPLPDDCYRDLQLEAAKRHMPATTMARHAIQLWLQANKKASLNQAISEYATAASGSADDLEPALERATLEFLMSEAD